ncbi:MAG: trypsin-like peptidase domain-containing protein [Saprospiraceae bacterium]|uniref:Trypsin-like peptidase domain-containing protein n=1 Tax=Candidatus Defluviibacterium haderslevense TaxID=2981993 RepID=A0A9D7SAC8_9BACT|nr:trypsin-like peptidase domain-containing protein [Candidatus Defluviibacterium haderslevense]
MKQIIEAYKDAVIQIATPYSIGTGFYLAEPDLIVTNEHVVKDNKEVVIEGKGVSRMTCPVIYIDPMYDLGLYKSSKSSSVFEYLFKSSKVNDRRGHRFGSWASLWAQIHGHSRYHI